MTSKEIAEKYVYGKHNALTDKQEVEDMIKDIEEYCKAINKNSVIPVVVLSDCDYGHNTLNKNDKPCKLMCCVKKEDYEQ